MAERPPPVMADPLDNRPDARAIKVEDLLADVRRGRIRVPSFQRGLKWERKQALELLDSIYRGYPVGTLLFWQTEAEASEVRYGTVTLGGPAMHDALWVVDGQQRIVSLARVLLANAADQDGFALFFDLDKGNFVAPPKEPDRKGDPSRWLPLTEALDSERLLQWAFHQAAGAQVQRRERAFQVGKRLREYELTAYLVRDADEATLREIFKRVNASGVRLEADQVFDALHGSRTTQRPATMAQISEELLSLGFGTVEPKLLYRLLRVLQGEDVTGRSGDGPLRLSDEDAAIAYAQTAAATGRVIQFLKDTAGISHFDLLPYKQPVVTLGKFFHHHPSPSPRSRELLRRWLWRGALNGSHRGDTVSTRKALAKIDPHDEGASVQSMLVMVNQLPEAMPSVQDAFNFRHAAGKLLVLAMLDLVPRHLQSGLPISLATLLDDAQAELPLPQLIHSTRADSHRLASVANRLIHPAQAALRTTLMHVSDTEVLTSHGVPPAAMQALHAGQIDVFLGARAEMLSEHARQFFARQVRWGDSDRPALATLLVPDEEPA